MINYLKVLNTVTANGADVVIDNLGQLNVSGICSIPATSIYDVQIQPAYAQQIQKATLTFTAANSTVYTFTLQGFSTTSGVSSNRVITFTSGATATASTISAQATAAVNALSGFNVSASDSGSGVVVLTASAATTACPNAYAFNVAETDSNIAVTAVATATAAAAPTGGRTAVLEPVINTSGVMTGIRIVDGGEGYLAAPAITIANGGGAGSAAPTATSIIFEGAVVGITFTAGTSYTYTAYKGFAVFGTGAAIKAFYGYNSNQAQAASAPAYADLALLEDGSNYTQVTISYKDAPISGITTFAQTTTTGQILVCVKEGVSNANDLIAGWGTFNNLRKGLKTNFSACVALDGTTAVTTTTFVVATGVVTLSAANSTGIQANDIVLAGATPAFGNTADTNLVAKVLSVASNTSVIAQIGGGNLIAAITGQTLATRVVKRSPIPR